MMVVLRSGTCVRLLLGLAASLTLLSSSCSRQLDAVPFLPAEYYACQEVQSADLLKAYFTTYFNVSESEVRYKDVIMLMKNIQLGEWIFKNLDQGCIWVDTIKCELVDVAGMRRFKVGDKVDIVGVNQGVLEGYPNSLLWTDCYVFRAGTVALPPGGSNPVVIGY